VDLNKHATQRERECVCLQEAARR